MARFEGATKAKPLAEPWSSVVKSLKKSSSSHGAVHHGQRNVKRAGNEPWKNLWRELWRLWPGLKEERPEVSCCSLALWKACCCSSKRQQIKVVINTLLRRRAPVLSASVRDIFLLSTSKFVLLRGTNTELKASHFKVAFSRLQARTFLSIFDKISLSIQRRDKFNSWDSANNSLLKLCYSGQLL